MTTLGAVLRKELRMLGRRRSFWVVQVLILALALLTWLEQTMIYDPTGLGYVSRATSLVLVAELLLLPVVAGPSITREFDTTSDVVWATPLDGLTHFVGMLAGLWLALMPALFLQIAARWLVGVLVIETRPELLWIYGLPLIVIGVTAGLGIVALLGMIVRRTVPLLVTWIALWGLNIYLVNGVPVETGVPVKFLFVLPQFELDLSPALGLGLEQPLLHSLALWFVGVALSTLLLGLAVALVADRRRMLRYVAPVVAWALIAGTVQGSGYVLHARVATGQAPPFSPRNNQLDAWVVRDHTLAATVDVERGRIDGTSTLLLETTEPTSTTEIVLRFNPGMTLTSVQDQAGQALTATQHGDSMAITLPAAPSGPLTLRLAWQGTPHPAHTDYSFGYTYEDSVGGPQPVRALLTNDAAYLLRDGDWYPWPWTTQPHQAERSNVVLNIADPRALTTAPLHKGTATWDGMLPTALLVVPPSQQVQVGASTLYVGELAIPHLIEQLTSLITATHTLATVIDTQPPQHVVALPYLNNIVWSGDLLLVPESGGYPGFSFVYNTNLPPAIHERLLLTEIAQAWLAEHQPVPSLLGWSVPTGAPLDTPRGRWSEGPVYGLLSSADEEKHRQNALTKSDQTALATWIAIELADPTVRDADLDAINKLAATTTQTEETLTPLLNTIGDRRLLAGGFDFSSLPLLPLLHAWAGEVGNARAIQFVGEAVRAHTTFDLEQLLIDLEQRSGVPLVEQWRALASQQ